MAFTETQFSRWFVEPLHSLQSQRAGFPQLMIALPLLERYLREKSGSAEEVRLNGRAYEILLSLFPQLQDTKGAKDFWSVFRNGLLHQVTMSQATASGRELPAGVLSFEVRGISREHGSFFINPSDFADEVLRVILADFSGFVGTRSPNHPLPEELPFFGRSSTANVRPPQVEPEVIGRDTSEQEHHADRRGLGSRCGTRGNRR